MHHPRQCIILVKGSGARQGEIPRADEDEIAHPDTAHESNALTSTSSLGAQVPRVISQPSTTSITQNADPAVPLPHHSSSRPHRPEALSNQQMWTTLETLKRQDQFHPSQFHALMPFHRLIRESECSDISFRDFAQEIWGAMEYKPDAAYCVDSLIDEYMPSRPVSEFDLKGSVSVPFATPSAKPLSTFAASMKREKTFYRRIPNSTKFLVHIP